MMDHDLGRIHMYKACLIHVKADRVLRSIVSGILAEYEVTTMEWLLLGVIDDSPKTGITLSHIAGRLDVSQPQVTALMDKVIEQGLVRQRVHKQDRRSRTAIITIKGKRLLDRIEESVQSFMETWLSELPKEQLRTYAETVTRIANYKP